MPEILNKSSKTGDQFMEISDLQNNKERVLFQPGNRQLSRKLQSKFIVLRYAKYSRDKDTSAFL